MLCTRCNFLYRYIDCVLAKNIAGTSRQLRGIFPIILMPLTHLPTYKYRIVWPEISRLINVCSVLAPLWLNSAYVELRLERRNRHRRKTINNNSFHSGYTRFIRTWLPYMGEDNSYSIINRPFHVQLRQNRTYGKPSNRIYKVLS